MNFYEEYPSFGDLNKNRTVCLWERDIIVVELIHMNPLSLSSQQVQKQRLPQLLSNMNILFLRLYKGVLYFQQSS